MRIILPKQTWRSEDEKRSLGSAGSKTVGVNQSPAMGSLAELDPLIVYGRQRKTQFVVLEFQKLRGHGYALAAYGLRHMPHVQMNTHRLFVFVQVRRYQQNASVFHESNHRRRRKHIRDKLLCPHFECRQISFRMGASRN